MRTRTKLADRCLPDYSRGEELMNMITHACGGGLGIVVLIFCILHAARQNNPCGIVAAAIYGSAMICTFTVSSVYHGLVPCFGKKVMQVIDHCTIYFLIAGTYTAVVLPAIRPLFPALGWGLFIFEWTLALIAATLTAIDLEKYEVFSMVCYIGMGWAILPFAKQTMLALTPSGFYLLLAGGIAYTVGAVLYGIGSRKKWMHSVFHIFVVLGAALQFLSILLYAL
jgi:hemolysin III